MSTSVSKYIYQHKTTTGKVYPVEIGYRQIKLTSISTDREGTIKACQEGCNLFGRNGGCPPFSPDFHQLSRDYSYGIIIYARLFTRDYPEKVLNGNYYVRWVLVENLLSRLMTKIGLRGKEKFDGYFLNTGHCIGCRQCAFKNGKNKCAKPHKRTFSLEATGVLVTDLVKNHLDFELQWWQADNPEYIPEYMTKVALLLTKVPLREEKIKEILPC